MGYKSSKITIPDRPHLVSKDKFIGYYISKLSIPKVSYELPINYKHICPFCKIKGCSYYIYDVFQIGGGYIDHDLTHFYKCEKLNELWKNYKYEYEQDIKRWEAEVEKILSFQERLDRLETKK